MAAAGKFPTGADFCIAGYRKNRYDGDRVKKLTRCIGSIFASIPWLFSVPY